MIQELYEKCTLWLSKKTCEKPGKLHRSTGSVGSVSVTLIPARTVCFPQMIISLPMFHLQMISECRVCNEIFRFQGDKVPRLLVCGHTVCHQCLTRLPLHGRTLLCPFDRQPTEIGDSGVWGLKKNFALLELLEKLQNPQQSPCRLLPDSILARERSVSNCVDQCRAQQ
jgi:hypothetical protein